MKRRAAVRRASARVFLLLVLATSVLAALPTAAAFATLSDPNTNGDISDLIAGPGGDLWYGAGAAIGRMTTSGVVTHFPLPNPTGFSLAAALTVGADGNVWFIDATTGMIGRVTPTGTFTEFSVPNNDVAGLTAGPGGEIWFTARADHAIGHISPTGAVKEIAFGDATQPSRLTEGPDGNLWFTDAAGPEIGRMTPAGVVTHFAITGAAKSIVVGPDGNLWANERVAHLVARITTAGVVSEFAANADELAAGADGNVWLGALGASDLDPPRVTRMTTDGVATSLDTSALPPGRDVNAITRGPDGHVWLAVDTGSLYWVRPDGTFSNDPPGSPTLSRPTVLSAEQQTASVSAAVNPNGDATTYHVEWGSTAGVYPNVGPTRPPTPLTGDSDQPAIGTLIGLSPSLPFSPPTVYHWRFVATNSHGSAATPDQTVETAIHVPPHVIVPPPTGCSKPSCNTTWNGGGSSGGGSTIVSYGWDWNSDGAVDTTCPASMPIAFHEFSSAGERTVTMTVTTASGETASGSATTVIQGPPSGATGSPTAGGCGVIRNNVPCQQTEDWELVHAVALDGVCWQLRSPELDRLFAQEHCQVCPPSAFLSAAPRAADAGVAPVSPTILKLLRNGSARILVAQAPTPGGAVRVEVNGIIIRAHQRPGLPPDYVPAVALDEYYDFVYASNADETVAGAASDPNLAAPIPLATNVQIDDILPQGYHVSGIRAARFGSARTLLGATGAAAANPCEDDPAVRSAPQLGNVLPNPSAAGLASAVDGFNLAGPVTVKIIDKQIVICVDVTLPDFGACPGSDGFGVKATLLAGADGLVVQNLRGHLGCAEVADIQFRDVDFAYDDADHHWSARGTVDVIPPPGLLSLTGDVSFTHGQLDHVSVVLDSSIPLGPVILSGIDIRVARTDQGCCDTSGSLTVGTFPKVPILDASLLEMSAGYEVHPNAPQPYIRLTGQPRFLGSPFGGGDVTYYYDIGALHATAHVDIGIKNVLSATGDVSAWLWQGPVYDIYGAATVSVLDLVHVGGDARFSSKGAAACVDISGIDHIGAKIYWSGRAEFMWNTCDVASGIVVAGPKPARDSRANGASAPTTITVAKGTPTAIIGVTGAGAVPHVVVSGPGGARFIAGTATPYLSPTYDVLHQASADTTYVLIPHPTAGRWRVAAVPGSASIASVRYGTTLPTASVRATVTGRGVARTLHYRIRPIQGQTVQLYESAGGALARLGRPTARAAGTIRFAPASGRRGVRAIVAVVLQNGLVRTQLTAGHYHLEHGPLISAPTDLTAHRVKHSLVVTWNAVTGARSYVLSILTNDGRTIYHADARRRYVLARFATATTARVRVTATAGLLVGASARLTVRAAVHHRN